MSSIPKSTVKFLRDNITSENSKLIPVFRDVREIISEFYNCKSKDINICIYQNIKIEKQGNYYQISKERK